jgi:hypothetical protein
MTDGTAFPTPADIPALRFVLAHLAGDQEQRALALIELGATINTATAETIGVLAGMVGQGLVDAHGIDDAITSVKSTLATAVGKSGGGGGEA